ncbi:MFS transporter [Rhodovastum atsumiense]|uniref:MFS transporter n=2 Tax=Rhodovastum atsumiense TaxID=504468 RepID=A0A5M6IL68_9PROT|nr:MFS transporter [Rhodovastum atsumiense]
MEYADGLPAPQRRRAMLTIAIALAMAVVGSAIANVALPAMAHDLGARPAEAVWVVNAYQIAVLMTLLPFASLGDIHGLARVFGIGLAVFTAASLACAMAPSMGALIAARVVQGLGAAGMMSVNVALVRATFPARMFGRGLGMNSLIVAASLAAGPSVAAAVLAVADWPWLFALNLPFGLTALAMLRSLPQSPASGHGFDLPSAVMSAATFGLFTTGLNGLSHGEAAPLVVLQFVATFGLGGMFVRRQLMLAQPMLPIQMFRRPVFALSVATSVCSFLAQTLASVALPFGFIVMMGRSQAEAGLMMTAWPVAVAVVAPLSGWLSDRASAGLLGGIGLMVMTLGLALLATMPADASLAAVTWRMALAGVGTALFQSPNNRQMLSAIPREQSGAGSGILATARLLGQTGGAALVSLVFALTEAAGVGRGVLAALMLAVGFGALGAVLSSLRLMRR